MNQRKEARYARAVERNLTNAEQRAALPGPNLVVTRYKGMSFDDACQRLGIRVEHRSQAWPDAHRIRNLIQ